MTWAPMWPMKPIRESQMRTRTKAILGEWKGHVPSTESAWDENRVFVKTEGTKAA